MTHPTIRWARTALTATAVALALGAAACGDDNDAGNDGGDGRAGAADGAGAGKSDGGQEFSGREAEINEVLVGVQDAFVELDGAGYCEKLAPAGIRQVERFGKAFAYGDQCAEIIDAASKATRDAGVKQKPTKLISVKFRGDRAIATVSNGGRPPEPMTFVNHDGNWKIPDPGFSADIGGKLDSEPLSSDPAKRFKQVKRSRDRVKQTDR